MRTARRRVKATAAAPTAAPPSLAKDLRAALDTTPQGQPVVGEQWAIRSDP
jgi:hypothetical protein